MAEADDLDDLVGPVDIPEAHVDEAADLVDILEVQDMGAHLGTLAVQGVQEDTPKGGNLRAVEPLPPWMVGRPGILGALADANIHLVLVGALMGLVGEVLLEGLV